MTEAEMYQIREEQRDMENVIEFLKEHNRNYAAAQVGLLLDRYHSIKYRDYVKDPKSE